ncbi:MAG TPA: hypothetical protein VNZ57_11225, partial [Longimicrobiales bacterium]|nr:hypothetical protein [Longimicrobiales bacterium]
MRSVFDTTCAVAVLAWIACTAGDAPVIAGGTEAFEPVHTVIIEEIDLPGPPIAPAEPEAYASCGVPARICRTLAEREQYLARLLAHSWSSRPGYACGLIDPETGRWFGFECGVIVVGIHGEDSGHLDELAERVAGTVARRPREPYDYAVIQVPA